MSLRYFTVFGPRLRPDLAISIFTGKALRGEPIEIYGDGKKTRDFTFIENIVEANIQLMKKGSGEINIGSNERTSITQLAEKIKAITGSDSEIIYSGNQKGDAQHTFANIDKARAEFGYNPVIKLDKGLELYVEWYKENKM